MKKNNKRSGVQPLRKKQRGNKTYTPAPQLYLAHPRKRHVSLNPAQMYKLALVDPFSEHVSGVKIPDMYSAPTATRRLVKSITVGTNGGGDFDLIILPNAYMNAISPRGCIPSGSTWSLGDGSTVGAGAVFTNATSLAGALTNYRIVSMGVRVRGVGSLTTTSGRIYAVTVPINSFVNDKTASVGGITPNINNANATAANTIIAYGLPNLAGAVDYNNMLNYPVSTEASIVSIAEKPLTIVPKVCGPSAFEFRQTSDRSMGFDIANQSSIANVQVGDASYLKVGGFEAVAIAGNGPINTTLLEVEIIYHLEGNPFPVSSGISAGTSNSPLVDPIAWIKAIENAARSETFQWVASRAMEYFLPGGAAALGIANAGMAAIENL